jgi:putative ABC transport system permease protein
VPAVVAGTPACRIDTTRFNPGPVGPELRQFLIEAFVLSVLGRVIGIALGIGTAALLTELAVWPTKVSADAVLIAYVFGAAVGIFFGFWPARKASQLDPIDALRYE